MQYNRRNCLFIILASFVVILSAIAAQAQINTTAGSKSAAAPAAKSTTAAAPTGTTSGKTSTTSGNTGATSGITAKPATKTTATANVATVNGSAVSRVMYDRAMAPYQKQIASLAKGAVTSEQLTKIKTKVLDNLIATELLYQESKKTGITIEEKEISETYEKQKTSFSTNAEFLAALKESNYNEKTFKDQIKIGLTIQHFINNKFSESTTVSDDEVKKYYDDNPTYFQQPAQVKASHIMIAVDSSADQTKKDEAKQKLEDVLKRLKAGEDFAALAKEVSQDADSKDKGGDLDYFYKGTITLKNFEDTAFALNKGETSGIVETEVGYHIIKVTDKVEPKTITLEESKEDIKTGLKSNKVNTEVNKYINELRAKANVKILITL